MGLIFFILEPVNTHQFPNPQCRSATVPINAGKFQPIKIAKRFYWLNAFLTKSKSVLTENVLNQLKIIEIIKIGGFNRNTIQIIIKINEVKILRIFQS